jgi:hypothetical protein
LEDSEEVEENLTYLVSLYAKSENKYNRDEIRDIANNMTFPSSAEPSAEPSAESSGD